MTDVLRIKRRLAGGAAGAPASLQSSEIAFNEQDRTLYYGLNNGGGTTTSIIPIAGSGAFLPLSGGQLSNGLSFGSSTNSERINDLSRHISLFDGWGGFNITSGSLNVVAGGVRAMSFGGTASIEAFNPLLLSRDPPLVSNEAATKNYVDGAVTRAGGPFLPLGGGVVTGGTGFNVGLTVGTGTNSPNLIINGATNTTNGLVILSGGQNRWLLGKNNYPNENAANDGADLSLYRYGFLSGSDGGFLGTTMSFRRSDGKMFLWESTLQVARDPAANMEVVTLQYLNSNTISTAAGDARWVNVGGDTVTGPLHVPGGIDFDGNTAPANNPRDTSKHITLWGTTVGSTYGFSITSSTLNYNTVAGQHDFYTSATLLMRIGAAGFAPQISAMVPFKMGSGVDLWLDRDPSDPTHAANKNYVDGAVTRAGGPFLPLTGGNVGTTNFSPQITVNNAGTAFLLLPGLAGGSYNGLVQTNDAVVLAYRGAPDTGALTFVPWSNSSLGIRIDGAAHTIRMDSANGLTINGPSTKISNPSDGFALIIGGATKGVRFLVDNTAMRIEGVDYTGTLTYQPLYIGGSSVTLTADTTANGQLTVLGHAGFRTGIDFNPNPATTPTNLSGHIDLYAGVYGFSISNDGAVNHVSAGFHNFYVGTTSITTLTSTLATIKTTLQVNGQATFSGANPQLNIDGPASTWRTLQFYSSGAARWNIQAEASTESGDAGSDLLITRWVTAGPQAILRISRATGLATVLGDPTAALGIATRQYVDNNTVTLTAGDARWVNVNGDAMVGALTLAGVSTAPLAAPGTNTSQIASTQFVTTAIGAISVGVTTWNGLSGAVTMTNAHVIGVLPSSATLPVMDGTALAGSSTAWSRGDHVHPTDTTRYAASNPAGYITSSSLPLPSSTLPLMDGAAAIGAGTAYARDNHVHPSDTSRLATAGGTITGNLTVNGATTMGGALQANNWLIAAYNTNITPSPGGSGIISWNRTQGGGEVNFYNTYNATGMSFDWRQVTATGVEKTIMQLHTAGVLTLAGHGVSYAGLSGGAHSFGFSWDGVRLTSYIDNASVGPLAKFSDLGSYVAKAGDTMVGQLRVSVADNAIPLLINGATRGVRFFTSSAGVTIEGVDSTGVGSFQPLSLYGSALNFNQTVTMGSSTDIVLARDPSSDPHAATKRYVDGVVTRAGGPFLPLTGGNVTGKVDFYTTDWFNPLCAGPQYRSTLYVLSPDGKNAITGAAQTLNAGDYPDAIGIQGFGFNNLPASPTTAAWAGYFEARQYPGATSFTHGIEIDIANVSGVAATECSPYALTYPFSVGLSMQSGADVAGDSPALVASHASMAFYVGDNGARFQNGLMFKSTALVGTNGAGTGFGNAIGMAAGHKISWYLPGSGGEGSAITSVQTTGGVLDLFFDNGTAYFRDATLGVPQVGALAGVPASGTTAMALRVNNNAGSTVVQVLLGPPDSGGAGFRILRVPN